MGVMAAITRDVMVTMVLSIFILKGAAEESFFMTTVSVIIRSVVCKLKEAAKDWLVVMEATVISMAVISIV